MPRGMSYGLLPRAPVRCRCHTTATATAKQHTTETRMEVIIIRRLLGTMIATFLLHSDCICWATSFILAHGSGKNVDHFLHGRVFTPLQPPSSVPRPPSTARFPRPPLSFCRTEIALEISSLRNEWLLGAGAWLLRRTQSICGFFFTSFCTIILISILLRHKQRRSLTSPTSCARGATVTESKDCTQNYYYLLAQEFLVVLEVSYPGPGHWTGPAFLVTAQVCRFHLVR